MLSQTTQEAMRVVAPALAGVLIGAVVVRRRRRVPPLGGHERDRLRSCCSACRRARHKRPRRGPRSPRWSTRSDTSAPAQGLGLVALTTIGVVVIGFPYLTFLPTLADERYGVGAGGYGLMSGIAGLGAVVAGLLAPRRRWMLQRPWATVAVSGAALGVVADRARLAGVVPARPARPARRSAPPDSCSRRRPSR